MWNHFPVGPLFPLLFPLLSCCLPEARCRQAWLSQQSSGGVAVQGAEAGGRTGGQS